MEQESLTSHSLISVDLSPFFGILKHKTRLSGQAFKDKAREGWF